MLDPAELMARRAEFVRSGIPAEIRAACADKARILRCQTFAAALRRPWRVLVRRG